MWWLVLLLFEDPQSQVAQVRSQMQASIPAQRESVKLQRVSIKTQASITHPVSPRRSPAPAREFAFTPVFESSIMARAQYACDPLPQPEMASLIDFAAHEHNLSPLLVREVARQESGFRPCAVSSQGAMGLMQLMPETQTQLGVANPWDPRENMEAGSRLLRQLLDRYHGDLSLALSAYNAGAGRVDQAGGIPRIPETQNYVESILNRLLPNGAGTALDPALSADPLMPEGP